MIIAKGENKKFKKSLVLKQQKQPNLLHKKPREDDFFLFLPWCLPTLMQEWRQFYKLQRYDVISEVPIS